MGGSRQTLTWALAHRIRGLALCLALSALTVLGCVDASSAQEPPLGVPIAGTLPPRPGQAIPIGGWLLYPTVSQYTKYSDNVFNSPVAPISAWSFGIRPSLTAEWSNGIHTTDLYGNFDSAVYPTHNELNTFNWNTGFTQKYEALRASQSASPRIRCARAQVSVCREPPITPHTEICPSLQAMF